MFLIRRRKSPGTLVKSELGESFGHLMQAATYAANGVGATVGPRVQGARDRVAPTATKVRDRAATGWSSAMTTLTPLAVAASDGARRAGSAARKAKAKNMQKKKAARRRNSMVTGLLAAGAVAGVAGALAMRRRRMEQQWSEYEPTPVVPGLPDESATTVVAGSSNPTGANIGAAAVEKASERGDLRH